jgi:spermidine synthase
MITGYANKNLWDGVRECIARRAASEPRPGPVGRIRLRAETAATHGAEWLQDALAQTDTVVIDCDPAAVVIVSQFDTETTDGRSGL